MPKNIIIGPSNGWIYAQSIFSLYNHRKFLEESGVNALEFCINWDSKRLASLEKKYFINLEYKSLHLPDQDHYHSIEEQVALAKKLVKKQNIDCALVHPLKLTEDYLQQMRSALDKKFALENMDKNKSSGYDLQELSNLVEQYDLKLVLDVQHAYEHDHTMRYGWDLFQAMQPRIMHLHISGETPSNNHERVCTADNKDTILQFLNKILSTNNYPLILEEKYNNPIELKEEIDFLKREL